MPSLERQNPDLGPDPLQRRPFLAMQRRRCVVAAFHVDRRPHYLQQLGRADFRKNYDVIHAIERRDDFRAILRGIQRAARAFQSPHRFITVDRHQERVAQRTRGLEITDVADVQQIENPIGENKPAASRFLPDRARFLFGDDFL